MTDIRTAVPKLPWKPTHEKGLCEQCGKKAHHLFFILKKWVCGLCKAGAPA